MAKPTVTVVTRRQKKREIRHLVAGQTCQQSIGKIFHGMEVFGLTNGQFSFINVIQTILEQTGPADLDISTWVAANYELNHIDKFFQKDKIKRLRFFVDKSFPNRQPEFFQYLIDLFGQNSVRVSRVHAKFAVIQNDNWNIVIRTSMNLNENRRIENFEISDDKELAGYLSKILDSFFNAPFSHVSTRPGDRDRLQNVKAPAYKNDDSNDFDLEVLI